MPKMRTHIHSLNAGEVGKAALGRVDQEKARLFAEVQENIFGRSIGKGIMRSGTKYIDGALDNTRPRLIPFVKSVSDKALLEWTDSKLRVMIDDEWVTRPAVTASFGSWSTSTASGGSVTLVGDGAELYCPYRGGTATAKRTGTTSSANIEHALRIEIERGPIVFRCGSSDGLDDYISETKLDAGTHSLTFTPTGGSFYVQFFTRAEIVSIVTSCEVESAGVMELDAPWTTAQLRSLRYDRSKDVFFVAGGSWQQRKIERRSTTSWSVVLYQTNDGPFTSTKTADVQLTPGALSGNTTLTADRSFFKEEHVGALFKLFHEGQKVVNILSAANEYTDPIRINGVDVSDRRFTYSYTGTWTGTLSLQRSYDSKETGFITWSTATSNTSSSDGDGFDIPVWYRWGFKPGDYTSGSVTITISNGGSGGHGICRVVGYTSPTEVDIEILTPFKQTIATKIWYEGEWSDKRGWPTAVALHDGRLGWAREDRLWLSESDAYYTFGRDDDESITDASAISRPITAADSDTVRWMLSLQRLVFGTEGAEAPMRSNSFDEPVTPTANQVKNASTQGAADVSPVRIDKRGFFVQRSGNIVYELGYNFQEQDYDSTNLMQLHEFLGGDGIVELAGQRRPDTYLWCVRADGQCAVLLYDPKEKLEGWFRFVTEGEVESVAVLPGEGEDLVYMAVKRTINGADVHYIEVLQPQSLSHDETTAVIADCGIRVTGEPTISVTAAHLAGRTDLVAWAYGPLPPNIETPENPQGYSALTGLEADATGLVEFGGSYYDIWLGIDYTGKYQSSKLAYASQGGTALLQKKRVGPVGVLLMDAHPSGISIGPSFDVMDGIERYLRVDAGETEELGVSDYDEAVFPFEGEWDTDSRVCIKISAPYPATVVGVVVTVETNDS